MGEQEKMAVIGMTVTRANTLKAKLATLQGGAEELAVALHVVSERSTRLLAKTFDLSPARANTLVAGTLLLAATQRLLGVPLIVARAGVRDGVAISLLEQAAVAA